MPTRSRVAVSLVLALAVAATLASGRHLDVSRRPPKAKLPDRPTPTVTQSALERGCAAWGEALRDCLADPKSVFEFSGSGKF